VPSGLSVAIAPAYPRRVHDGVSDVVSSATSAEPEVVEARPASQVTDAVISPAGNVALGRLLNPSADRGDGGAARAPGLTPALVACLQRSAGNASVQGLVNRLQRAPLQRDPDPAADVPVTGVTVSAPKVTIPLSAALKATAQPATATGVTFSVEKGSVDPSNVTIDGQTGAITIATGQRGGQIDVKATSKDGAWATAPLRIIEKPTGIASTSASGAANYGGQFVHTFNAPSGNSSGLQGENINEKFASVTAVTPWGGNFTLTANAAGSSGWDLDSGGTMAGPDNVDIGAAGVDVGPFVKSASNPAPKGSLPQGFTMTQSLHAKSFPSGTLDGAAFTTVPHKRTLVAGPNFEVEAGSGKITEAYSGPSAVTNAAATPANVMASAPKPKTGDWKRNKVTVTADAMPSTRAKTYSITGKDLDCSVDANGEVSIGSTAGSITVRIRASDRNYDEVVITIAEYKAPSPQPKNAETGDAGASPVDMHGGAAIDSDGGGLGVLRPVQR
jgi:hypothetical protein